jgi:hypothetical protein
MNFWVIVFLLAFIFLMFANFWYMKRDDKRGLRTIPAFDNMHSSMEASVEDGSRIHFAIGRSEVTSPEIAAGIIGLNLLKRVGYITSDSDLTPVSSAGTGALMILSQDTIRTIYRELGRKGDAASQMGLFTGPTPFSYAAGSALNVSEAEVSTNLMIGSFGIEAGLLTHAGDNSKTLTIAGSDDILGQAVIYATTYEPLIGEEVFASGAYFGMKDIHRASLFTQDIMRILIIIGISAISIYSLIRGLIQ